MSYEPRSLNPNIMEKRINDLSKASGGGGFELPIASAETLGGIKIPADSGITITGSGNAYAAKSYDYGVEVDTGRKINGKSVYVKLITLVNPVILSADTGLAVLDDISDIDYIIDVKVFSTTSVSCANLMTYEQEGKLFMVSPYSYEVRSLIIEYTKED